MTIDIHSLKLTARRWKTGRAPKGNFSFQPLVASGSIRCREGKYHKDSHGWNLWTSNLVHMKWASNQTHWPKWVMQWSLLSQQFQLTWKKAKTEPSTSHQLHCVIIFSICYSVHILWRWTYQQWPINSDHSKPAFGAFFLGVASRGPKGHQHEIHCDVSETWEVLSKWVLKNQHTAGISGLLPGGQLQNFKVHRTSYLGAEFCFCWSTNKSNLSLRKIKQWVSKKKAWA